MKTDKVAEIYELKDMPFDKYDDSVGFIHATGREIRFEGDPRWYNEYEGDWTEDLPATDGWYNHPEEW